MNNLTKYTRFAILFNGIALSLNCFNLIPTALSHVLIGMGFALILFSAFVETHNMEKLKNYKRNLFKKVLSR